MDGEEVGAAHELLDRRDEIDAELAGAIGAHVGVVGHELHAERVGPLRDEHTDATEADDAERLVVQLDALPPGAVPLAGPEVAVGLRHVAGLGEQQRDGVLRRRQHVGLRRVHDHDAAAGGRLDVDVVEADAGAPDDDELVGRLEDLGGDLRGAADHERRRTPHRVEQLLGREPETDVDLEPGAAHGLEPAVGELLADQDALHRIESRRSAGSDRERLQAIRGCGTRPGTMQRYRVRHFAMRSTPSTSASSARAKLSRA